jgi:hypothetical protein
LTAPSVWSSVDAEAADWVIATVAVGELPELENVMDPERVEVAVFAAIVKLYVLPDLPEYAIQEPSMV